MIYIYLTRWFKRLVEIFVKIQASGTINNSTNIFIHYYLLWAYCSGVFLSYYLLEYVILAVNNYLLVTGSC